MNRTLVEIVADYAVLMELSAEDDVSLETSTRALESIGWRLQGMTPTERGEFAVMIRQVAEERASPAEREFLSNLPDAAGLTLDG